ncbi:MAG: DNA/RNA nuclease SfsA [Desulfobulbaceae bacterium]|jgi:sugar fermentation stimulation protein A|nr:DNA/RNA nuclease SfsA [Desulfobulbaceae bacterium]
MKFSGNLPTVTLVRRYQRFLAEVIDEHGETFVAHCPNTGSMLGCCQPGSQAAISLANNPARKYRYTLEMVRQDGVWIGVNSARANTLIAEALAAGRIDGFDQSWQIQAEVKAPGGSRLDFRLRRGAENVYLEVKSCSLALNGRAMFPDAKTERGRRHLVELMNLTAAGQGAAILFLAQRQDTTSFAPADHIDSEYGQALRQAAAMGVRVLAYDCAVSPAGIKTRRAYPVSSKWCETI